METIVAVGGSVTIGVAWAAIRRGAGVWSTMTPTLLAVGLAAVLVRSPVAAGRVSTAAAVAVGLGSGSALFVATRVFVRLTRGWGAFQVDAQRTYRATGQLAIGVIVALASVSVVAEELFWRGLVQPSLATGSGLRWAAVATWAITVAVNVPSGSISIVLGAAVGGAVWAALGAWSAGVVASLACHLVWTVGMIVLPPSPRTAGR